MAKKKKKPETIRVKFNRNYRDETGRYPKGSTPVLEKEYGQRMIDERHAVIYVDPPVPAPPEKVKTETSPADPKLKGAKK